MIRLVGMLHIRQRAHVVTGLLVQPTPLCAVTHAVQLLVVLERVGISLAPKYSTHHTASLYQIFGHFLINHNAN